MSSSVSKSHKKKLNALIQQGTFSLIIVHVISFTFIAYVSFNASSSTIAIVTTVLAIITLLIGLIVNERMKYKIQQYIYEVRIDTSALDLNAPTNQSAGVSSTDTDTLVKPRKGNNRCLYCQSLLQPHDNFCGSCGRALISTSMDRTM